MENVSDSLKAIERAIYYLRHEAITGYDTNNNYHADRLEQAMELIKNLQ